MHQFGNASYAERPALSATGSTWAVSAPHADASDSAAAAFARGGNAVDAAVAAAAMLTVVYPNQCSVGGDLIALVAPADGGAFVVNSSGRSPRALSVGAFDTARAMPTSGALSVTVPGAVAGWAELLRRWGRLSLDAALSRAVEAAADGLPVAPGLARDLVAEQRLLGRDEGARSVFFRDGRVLGVGDQLRQPQLAASLQAIAEHGPEALYAGQLGASLVELLRRNGSAMAEQDFVDHRVGVGPSVSRPFGGLDYLTSGDNTQGTFFLQGLNALRVVTDDGEPLNPMGPDAGLVARVLSEVARDRDRLLADPEVAGLPTAWLLSTERAVEIAAAARGAQWSAGGTAAARASGDTVAVVAADADGNWISLIQSVFHAFGSGLVDPRTGILLHNRGASFSLDPRAANRLTPGARPPHTLMPVLVRRHEEYVGAHGAMGGRAQAQVHTHLALHQAGESNPLDMVSAPRWVLGAMEAGAATSAASLVKAEEGVPASAQSSLRANGFRVDVLPGRDDAAGHAQVVRRETTGRFTAASDPRADGAAFAG